MNDRTSSSKTRDAFCLGCGYCLRQLTERRCPECGRAFDPDDARTMSLGKPLWRWQRWLLRPLGWRTISLAILGTAGLVYLGRWPGFSPEPWSVLRGEFRWYWPVVRPLTVPGAVWATSAILWALFLVLAIFWQLARLLVPRAARRAKVRNIDTRWRRCTLIITTVVAGWFLIFGWEHRIGRRWVARVWASPPLPTSGPASWGYYRFYPPYQPPMRLSQDQASAILGDELFDATSPEKRLSVLRLLVENGGRAAFPALLRSAKSEQDATLLEWELRLIGLCRDPSSAPLLIRYMNDSRSQIRAAAIDALGILRRPSYSIYVPDGFYEAEPLALDITPPIDVVGVVSPAPAPPGRFSIHGYSEHDLIDDPAVAIDPSVQPRLLHIMADGLTAGEREAAARALVAWPPENCHLRIAEWGVWINNKGQMALARSVLDEIPPFVHGTGNPVTDFAGYFLYPSVVTKPIIHLTSNTPLSVDLEVQIKEGRPWFAFPKPDDLGFGTEPVERIEKPLAGLGVFGPLSSMGVDDYLSPAVESMADCREGYPWLVPHHRLYLSGWHGNATIYRLGLRWQGLIVTPDLPSWTSPPIVPRDPRFAWWQRLRQVPGSWVTNRGETERFLYYDGPTKSAVPVAVELDQSGHRIRFATRHPELASGGWGKESRSTQSIFHPLDVTWRRDLTEHEGLYIEVHGGAVRGQVISTVVDGSVALAEKLPLEGEAVVDALRQMLIRYGLSGPEAEGQIAAWSPQFFHAEGRRFVLRMSPDEYARQCPMQCRPTPTEVVRLGLVLSEFDAPRAAVH